MMEREGVTLENVRRISRLGLGLAALGRPGYINLTHAEDLGGRYDVEALRSRSHEVLDAAWAAGVRYYDAARSYGRAEEFLGGWLAGRGVAPQDAVVASKWGYTYTAGWKVHAEEHEVKEHSHPVLKRQWQETQERLDGHLDLYQVHSATLESGVLENAAVLQELARLRETGVAMGLTLSGPGQAETLGRALELRVQGQPLFSAVQATWNLLEPSAAPALAAAAEAGWLVIVKEAVANGRLTPANDAPAFAAQRALLRGQAERLHTTVDALALAAALAQPWAGVVLLGAATVEHLRSNVRALTIAWDEEAAAALAALAEAPEKYWETRAELEWQ